tara:strand:- start:27184 stop:27348 length:165 start_codon:yes stop_codon:yes gene_type:complete
MRPACIDLLHFEHYQEHGLFHRTDNAHDFWHKGFVGCDKPIQKILKRNTFSRIQ